MRYSKIISKLSAGVLAGSLAILASPTTVSAATPRASYMAFAIEADGTQAIKVTGSLFCPETDTVTVKIIAYQSKDNVIHKDSGKAEGEKTVTCDRTIREHTTRVAFVDAGDTVDPNALVLVTTTVFNSNGSAIGSDSNLLSYPAPPAPDPFATPAVGTVSVLYVDQVTLPENRESQFSGGFTMALTN